MACSGTIKVEVLQHLYVAIYDAITLKHSTARLLGLDCFDFRENEHLSLIKTILYISATFHKTHFIILIIL